MLYFGIEGYTVRLLTHVLCKPTHFFFHYGVPPRGHLQGQTRDSSNTRIFTLKRNIYTCVLIWYLSFIYVVSYLVWSGLFFLSYSTYIWNAYVAGNLLRIKNAKNEACQKQTHTAFNYFIKITKLWGFINLTRPWKKVIL